MGTRIRRFRSFRRERSKTGVIVTALCLCTGILNILIEAMQYSLCERVLKSDPDPQVEARLREKR